MPWGSSDAARHTRAASSAKKKRLWAGVANSVLAQTGNEGRAVRAGNAAVRRRGKAKR